MSADLFAGMAVDYGSPRPSLDKARRLLERTADLESVIDDYVPTCTRLANEWRQLGAHSVARAVRFAGCWDAADRHGYDHLHITAERLARRWVGRLEREALRGGS